MLSEAFTLGLESLGRIGFVLPPADQLAASIEQRLSAIQRWCDDEDAQLSDGPRSEAIEPRAIGAAKLINRMMSPAFLCDHAVLAWLVLESVDLWSEHGPQAALIGPIGHAGLVITERKSDYQLAYRVTHRVLTLSKALGYEPQTSLARFLFSGGSQPWFEPLEDSVSQSQIAREGLVQGGDLQNACFTYYCTIPFVLQCASTLDEYSAEVEAESHLAFAPVTIKPWTHLCRTVSSYVRCAVRQMPTAPSRTGRSTRKRMPPVFARILRQRSASTLCAGSSHISLTARGIFFDIRMPRCRSCRTSAQHP
jgi:hypothetical protein